MYLFSSKYIQINNNTKIRIKVLIDITPLVLGLGPLLFRHLETKSFVADSSGLLESEELSLENLG